MVASYGDEVRMRGKRIVLLEHGAGQSYTHGAPANPCYSGGARHGVELFLCPNEAVKRRWTEAYPGSRAEVVGSPKLDCYHRPPADDALAMSCHDRSGGEARPVVAPLVENSNKDRSRRGWHPGTGGVDALPTEPSRGEAGALQGPLREKAADRRGVASTPRPVVAFAFHWDGSNIVPEAGNAWPTFGPHLHTLTDRYEVLGHGHPRIFRSLRPHYERMGVEPVADWREVFSRADLLAVDNSSIGPEFAATGKPVLWLNAPHYRRDVWHGGRFWEWPTVQVQCDEPAYLGECVDAALHDGPSVASAREAMVASIYAFRDGLASVRAADAIRSVVDAPRVVARRNRDPFSPRRRAVGARRSPPIEPDEPVALTGVVAPLSEEEEAAFLADPAVRDAVEQGRTGDRSTLVSRGSFASDPPETDAEAVIEWVSGNKERAKQALVAETERADPREEVVSYLEGVLEPSL